VSPRRLAHHKKARVEQDYCADYGGRSRSFLRFNGGIADFSIMSDRFAQDVSRDGVRGHGENFFLGLIAGVVAMGIGAAVWIRIAGDGRGMIFGILGAVLTFLGCLGGDVLTVVQQSTGPSLSFMDALRVTDMTQLVTNLFSKMDVITYVAYGVGIYEGFTISRRK
jgi:hypothetical protein